MNSSISIILLAILLCVASSPVPETEDGKVVKRSPQSNPFGFDFGIIQNCQGGKCNQNNQGGFGNVQLCGGGKCNQNNLGGFGHVQGCQGSQCNQNNLSSFFGR